MQILERDVGKEWNGCCCCFSFLFFFLKMYLNFNKFLLGQRPIVLRIQTMTNVTKFLKIPIIWSSKLGAITFLGGKNFNENWILEIFYNVFVLVIVVKFWYRNSIWDLNISTDPCRRVIKEKIFIVTEKSGSLSLCERWNIGKINPIPRPQNILQDMVTLQQISTIVLVSI